MTEQQLKAKEYLMQTYRIDIRINSKIEQISSLHDMATKATSTLSDMPGSVTRNVHRMEDVIVKIVDLEEEIRRDMNSLIDIKKSVVNSIRNVVNVEARTVLEQRYLCYMQWEQIAVGMGYTVRQVFRIHDDALKNIVVS